MIGPPKKAPGAGEQTGREDEAEIIIRDRDFAQDQSRQLELLCIAVQSLHRIEKELRKLQPPYFNGSSRSMSASDKRSS